jgi:CubicO group peptidase (beta-lactamase class C family)
VDCSGPTVQRRFLQARAGGGGGGGGGGARPFDAGTLFEIASNTKVFTALDLFLLAAEQEQAARGGALRANSTLGQLLPGMAGGRAGSAAVAAITLAELASHTSGLPSPGR